MKFVEAIEAPLFNGNGWAKSRLIQFSLFPVQTGCSLLFYPGFTDYFILLLHPGLAEIPAPDGSQDVISQLKDYPCRQ